MDRVKHSEAHEELQTGSDMLGAMSQTILIGDGDSGKIHHLIIMLIK